MISQKVKHHIEEYISQEVYVLIAIIKGKEKISTESAIDRYFNTNHFRDFSEGKPYFHFIDGFRDKCLGKLKNSPMRDKETEDLYEELLRLRKEQFGLRMQDASGQLGQYHLLSQVKRDIARVKTVIVEKQDQFSTEVEAEK